MYKNRMKRQSLQNSQKSGGNKEIPASKPLTTIGENSPMKIQKRSNVPAIPVCAPETDIFSQESIPASQEPTQRYLSQRSNICRTQSRSTQRYPKSYFELVLMKSGADLEKEIFLLSCDHVSFVASFRNILLKHPEYPDNIKTFKQGLKDALSSDVTALKLLSGCNIHIIGQETSYLSQDSMIVNFLMIDFLQDDVIELLLDKIEKCSKFDDILTMDIPLLPLMLTQLKYVTSTFGDQLFNKITNIFQNGTVRAKRDIISNAEFFLDPNKHDDFVLFLMEQICDDKELFNLSTIQTFTNLCLTSRIQTRLRRKINAYIKSGCKINLLPAFVKFLLKAVNDDDESLKELILDLRPSLTWKNVENDKGTINKSQSEVFNHIIQALTRSRKFFEIWHKTIQRLSGDEFNCLDFMILLILTTIREDKSTYIENIIRKRIKAGHIDTKLLLSTKTQYPLILEQQTHIFLQILYEFLQDKCISIVNFAKSAYRIMFGVSESFQKPILNKLVELTCDRSIKDNSSIALNVLRDLNNHFATEIQNWGLLLMPLLDRINDMNLQQSRIVMELLCSIAYPVPPIPDCPVLQDQIDMLVKKQVINRLSLIKKQGIIGTVQLIDRIARTEEKFIDNMYDLDATYNSVDDLPDGRGKLAANYISRVHSSTMYCPESLALFYDELATVFSPKNEDRNDSVLIDRHFLTWVSELITYYFQSIFVVENSPADDLGIKLAHEKCINTLDDTASNCSELAPIAINISELVLKPPSEAASSITILAPLFNLMRVLHFIRFEGSLESINAVLGCAIVLPTTFESENHLDLFDEFDDVKAKKLLDIYFHTANWLREVISSFASQNETMIRKKVLIRLSELIKLESIIRTILRKTPPDYMPPMCQFINSPTKTSLSFKKPVGRAKKSNNKPPANDNMETEDIDILTAMNPINNTRTAMPKIKKTIQFEATYGSREIYRQMDPDLMLILREEFNILYPQPKEDLGKYIGLLEFKFIIYDLVNKLESITGTQKFSTNEQKQYIVYPSALINDIVMQFLPKIMVNFEQIYKTICSTLESVNYCLGNADLFTDTMNHLKVCFALCTRLLVALFSWSGFDEETNLPLLKSAFLSVNGSKDLQNNGNVRDLATTAFTKFKNIEKYVIDIKSAARFYHLLSTIKKYTQLESLENKIRNICKTFLFRKWYGYDGSMEKGALCNIYLNELQKGFLVNSDFKRLKEILKVVIEEAKAIKKKDDCFSSFPNINKLNFPILFRGLCETLIKTINDELINISGVTTVHGLKFWEDGCEIINMLLDALKSLDVHRNFSIFLRYSHNFLKIFIQHGLTILESSIRKDPERVNTLLKTLQVTTRFLHNLCCHSKAIQNTSIVAQIPFLRETIEKLLFRVKAALAANKVESVFWMGNLKNKDLHGDEILSRTSTWMSTNPENDDEDEVTDDMSVDETVMSDVEMENENQGKIKNKKRTLRKKSTEI